MQRLAATGRCWWWSGCWLLPCKEADPGVPAILHGRSPVPVALVGAMAIMLVSLYLSHGISRKTTAAVVGTGLALVLTAALTAGFVAATSSPAWPARMPSTQASKPAASRYAGCC
jgi:YibE/F-like protein